MFRHRIFLVLWLLLSPILAIAASPKVCDEYFARVGYDVGLPRQNLPRMGEELFYFDPNSILEIDSYVPWLKRKEPHVVTKITNDKKFVELTGISGVRIYGKLLWDRSNLRHRFVRIHAEETPFDRNRFGSVNIGLGERDARALRFNPRTAKAKDLADSQLQASGTANNEVEGIAEVEKIRKLFIGANTDMLQKLESRQHLKTEDIVRWHRKATGYKYFVRGTKAQIKSGGSGEVGSGDDDVIYFLYTPGEVVPQRLEALIDRVNKLNKQSSIVDVTKIYQDFIIIHPFVNGNGRTSRILLDYMLLKTGFPPARNDMGSRDILFQTPEQIAESLLSRIIPE